ncbi:hypothetical protein B0H10DRAFT_1952978 [Mycena sp. CBHHK59/15]|nr:hypothetical protein B0H10DRAFT_1952978 [Mycena sp. CBHHK59/15]
MVQLSTVFMTLCAAACALSSSVHRGHRSIPLPGEHRRRRTPIVPQHHSQHQSFGSCRDPTEQYLTNLTVNTILMDARAHAWFDNYRFGIWPVEEKGSWYGKIFRFEQGRCDVDGEWLLPAVCPARFPHPDYGQPETSEQREVCERDEKEQEEDKSKRNCSRCTLKHASTGMSRAWDGTSKLENETAIFFRKCITSLREIIYAVLYHWSTGVLQEMLV